MNSLPYELIQYIYSFMDVRSVLGLSLASKELYKNAPKWRLCHKQSMKKLLMRLVHLDTFIQLMKDAVIYVLIQCVSDLRNHSKCVIYRLINNYGSYRRFMFTISQDYYDYYRMDKIE